MDRKRKQKTKEVGLQGLLGAQAGEGEGKAGEQVDVRLECFACGKVHGSSRLLHLPDGRTVGNYSEEYRLYAEAAGVLKRFRTRKTRQLHLAKVAEMRGQAGYERLRAAMLEIYEREKNDLPK
jgi:hypothetical protein